MKRVNRLRATVVVLFLGAAASAWRGAVTVEVSGVQPAGGLVSIGLYDRDHGWPDKGREYKGKEVTAVAGNVSHTFTDVPAGLLRYCRNYRGCQNSVPRASIIER